MIRVTREFVSEAHIVRAKYLILSDREDDLLLRCMKIAFDSVELSFDEKREILKMYDCKATLITSDIKKGSALALLQDETARMEAILKDPRRLK